MIPNHNSWTSSRKNSKSNNTMIDPSLRRSGSASVHRLSHSDLAVAPNASGVEKLLAASGLSSVLLQQAPTGPSSSAPPPAPVTAAAAKAPPPLPATSSSLSSSSMSMEAAAASLAGSLPLLSLIARASAASNLVAASALNNQGPYHHTLHSAAAVNSALSSIVSALKIQQSVGGGIAMPSLPDRVALTVSPSPSSLQGPTSLSSAMAPNATSATDAASVAAIRQEQIVEALRSKPQRGRKRENLNDYERMELTRTRNREHAKSTRIRKKARHEELLEMEHRFRSMADQEAKDDHCRELVTRFFALRTRAIQAVTDPSSSGGDVDELRLEDIMDENASFVFDALASPKSSTAATVSTTSSSNSNNNSSSSSSSNSENGESRTRTSSLLVTQLASFDEAMRTKATKCLGQAVIPMLSYSVQGGKGGIALSKTHSAFCRVDLMLAHSLQLVRGIATFEFTTDSPAPPPTSDDSASVAASVDATKISSVQWIPVQDVAVAGALEAIDPMAIVAMAAESAESRSLLKAGAEPGRLTASSISRHNASHHDSRSANVSSSSCGSSVVASSKGEGESEGCDGDAA